MQYQAVDVKRRTAWLSVASNSVLVVLKLVIGIVTGSVSLISEGLHSSVDLIASLIASAAVYKAATPPDKEHDYGHGKYENLSAAVEAVLILAAAGGIIYESLHRLDEPQMPVSLEYGMGIMVLSMIINYFVSRRMLAVAKATCSQALEADAQHLRADILTSFGVLLGMAGMYVTGWSWLDPVVAIAVACIIFHIGYMMVVEAVRELTDRSLSAEEEAAIANIFAEQRGVVSFHCLRTRRSGGYKLLDVHLLFPAKMELWQVHDICDEVERKIRSQLGPFDVLIHPEPAETQQYESKRDQYEKSMSVE